MGKIDTPYDDLTHKIIGLAMEVHNELGPGFNEETYHRAMMIVLMRHRFLSSMNLLLRLYLEDKKWGNVNWILLLHEK